MKKGKRKSKNDLLKQIISKNNLIKWIILGVLILVALFVIFKVFTGQVTNTNPECYDSDGGLNSVNAGYVLGINFTGSGYKLYDACNSDNTGVYERYCNGTFDSIELISCPEGCNNPYGDNSGACITNASQTNNTIYLKDSDVGHYCNYATSSETIRYLCPSTLICFTNVCRNFSCTDSDAGSNSNVKGTLNYKIYGEGNTLVNNNNTDSCVYGILREYYSCDNNGPLFTDITCPNGCKEGACTPLTTTPSTTTTTPETPTPSEPTPTASPTESEITAPTTTEDDTLVCTSGCLFVKSCLPYGHRTALNYCNIDNTLVEQVSEGTCINNFECTSNVCVEGQCTSPGLFLQFLNWFRALFGVQ